MRFWSDEETKLLQELWMNPKVTRENLLRIFKERSWNSLDGKRKQLDLQNFQYYRVGELDKAYLEQLRETLEI